MECGLDGKAAVCINILKETDMLNCKFCEKTCKNHNSLINHERLCAKNPNKTVSPLVKWKKEHPDLSSDATKRGSFKPGSTPYTKGKPGTFKGKTHSVETKLIMCQQKNALYQSGWEPTCGRCKKYDYESSIAGKIKVDGTWELKVAKYLDFIGVEWNRNKKRFSYLKKDGRLSTYQPDFYIKTWGTFLEVKGYETELDKLKWSQFKEPLIIWKRKEIENLENVSDRV